jgi:hypothetical protein
MAQTVIRAPESTGNIPAARRVRDVANRIEYLDPDIAPLTLITQKARTKTANNSTFEWIEKDLAARWDQINHADYTNETSIVVDNGDYFSVGDVVNVPRTAEKMLVTAVDPTTDELTVVRSYGPTAIGTLVNNEDLQIIGNAYAEGAVSGSAKSHIETYPFNYTQITRTPLQITRTEMNSENYTGADRPRLRAEKNIEHRLDLERTALFGERLLDTSSPGTTDGPVRTTGGAFYFLTGATNETDAGGILSASEMESFCQDVFQHTGAGNTRLFVASPLLISVFDLIALGRMQLVPSDKVYGMTVKQWVTGHGTLMIVKHRLLEDGPGGVGYGGYGLALDMDKFMIRPLANSNTKLYADIQENDRDGVKDEYLTEAGWQISSPLVHGILSGVTG